MTPEEKAKELVWKSFRMILSFDILNGHFDVSKQCALIAVDEMIEALFSNDEHIMLKRKFFLEVKTELEKL